MAHPLGLLYQLTMLLELLLPVYQDQESPHGIGKVDRGKVEAINPGSGIWGYEISLPKYCLPQIMQHDSIHHLAPQPITQSLEGSLVPLAFLARTFILPLILITVKLCVHILFLLPLEILTR